VVLNYAYANITLISNLKLTAGQMKNPVWEPMEFLWDSDITPQGGAVQVNYKVNEMLSLIGTRRPSSERDRYQ